MIEDENNVVLGGTAGERVNVSDDPKIASRFSVKTVRTIHAMDGDSLDKFDWHTIICRDRDIVRRIRTGMRVRVTGLISTTSAKSAIIADSVELETGERWPDERKRRRAG